MTYVVSGTPLRHHEVEIVACSGTDAKTLATLARAPQETFSAAPQPWRMSKLHTGVALAALVARLGPMALAAPSG